MPNVMNEAEKATSAVRAHVQTAVERLDKDAAANAYGILMHPLQYRWNLLAAIDELKKAAETINAARWPTDSDYDRIGG